MGSRRRRWGDLTATQKVLLLVLVSVQLSLAVSAWADLARRPADQVNGPKRTWAAVIAVNFIGPVLYFRRGRRGRPPAGPGRTAGAVAP